MGSKCMEERYAEENCWRADVREATRRVSIAYHRRPGIAHSIMATVLYTKRRARPSSGSGTRPTRPFPRSVTHCAGPRVRPTWQLATINRTERPPSWAGHSRREWGHPSPVTALEPGRARYRRYRNRPSLLVSSLPARRAEQAGPHLHKPLTTASRANAANSYLRSNSGDGSGCLTARRGISHSQMCRIHRCVALTVVSHSQTCHTHSHITPRESLTE